MANPQTNTPSLDLAPLHLPPEPSAWPLAWGWWLVIVTSLLLCIGLIWLWKKRANRLQTQKLALKQIHQAQNAQQLQDVLRRACLTELNREQVARLTGLSWARFLDQKASISPSFTSNWTTWEQALYQGKALDDTSFATCQRQSQQWLKQALPFKAGSTQNKAQQHTDSGASHA
ncbi:MAG: DUF4381 domain-containing protein [Vibrio sp.]